MSNYIHASTSRPPIKINTTEQEEAGSQLKLGEFQHTPTLSLSEARIVIDAILDTRAKQGKRHADTEVLSKMQDYLDTFARFKRKETATEVGEILDAHSAFEPFEKSQLASLCCENYDEAKTLVPSIQNKIGDAELSELLAQISNRRNFVD
ncbi:MAG: hypothetical protein INR71_14460 [Terriglobus roseus]|nr:hypothetical protein [Terriglobus roseus]